MYGTPLQSIQLCSESGYMNSDLFLVWLEHFTNYVRPRENFPVLLILDNHISHVRLEAILFCRWNFIILLSLPPHASHRLQPLDVGFFNVLKGIYSTECDNWLSANSGHVISQKNFGQIFGKAYAKVMHVKYVESNLLIGIFLKKMSSCRVL